MTRRPAWAAGARCHRPRPEGRWTAEEAAWSRSGGRREPGVAVARCFGFARRSPCRRPALVCGPASSPFLVGGGRRGHHSGYVRADAAGRRWPFADGTRCVCLRDRGPRDVGSAAAPAGRDAGSTGLGIGRAAGPSCRSLHRDITGRRRRVRARGDELDVQSPVQRRGARPQAEAACPLRRQRAASPSRGEIASALHESSRPRGPRARPGRRGHRVGGARRGAAVTARRRGGRWSELRRAGRGTARFVVAAGGHGGLRRRGRGRRGARRRGSALGSWRRRPGGPGRRGPLHPPRWPGATLAAGDARPLRRVEPGAYGGVPARAPRERGRRASSATGTRPTSPGHPLRIRRRALGRR